MREADERKTNAARRACESSKAVEPAQQAPAVVKAIVLVVVIAAVVAVVAIVAQMAPSHRFGDHVEGQDGAMGSILEPFWDRLREPT